MTADPVELAIGQHPQQAGLHIQRHVADFIEKQGTAIGLLEATVANVVGTGKGPFFMTEQLGFDEILGMAAMLRAMKFLWARGLCLCSAWATSSLPVPL